MRAQGRVVEALLRPLRPLGVPQYRLLGGSLLFELAAAGVWIIALVWEIVGLGGDASDLSVVATAGAVGVLLTSLLGGVAADRIRQRTILRVVAAVRTVAVAVVAALALTDQLSVSHLVVVAGLVGLAQGFTYPAYSALLPSIVPAQHLMAANGLEGMLRPVVMQAAGPAAAGALVAAYSPAAAFLVVAGLELGGLICLMLLAAAPLRRALDGERHTIGSAARDLHEGFAYMVRTPWLLATLLFASVMVLLVMGPIEVLMPFVIKDRAGGGPGDHALVLAAFGIGGALGSFVMAMRRMPRRYLTVMNVLWGLACVPLIAVGFTRSIPVMIAAVFVVGMGFNSAMVIWGTLLQRRVPPHLLGRVASLDFFVSLVFMPVSMALAGPVSDLIGMEATFVLVGVLPLVFAVVAIVLARMPSDEIAHPLDQPSAGPPEEVLRPEDDAETVGTAAVVS